MGRRDHITHIINLRTTRRTRRGVVLVVATAMTLAGCSGDDGGGAPAPTEPPTTAATTTPPTTSAPTTTAAATTTEAPTTTTAAPTTTTEPPPPTFTSAELAAALPVIDDLGPDWIDYQVEPTLDPAPGEGPGVGVCGGANAAGRAGGLDLVGSVSGGVFEGPDARTVGYLMYSFGSPDDAATFVARTAEAANCPDGFTWELPQGPGPGEHNGFGDPEFGRGAIWRFDEVTTSEPVDAADLDEVLLITRTFDQSTTVDGVDYGERSTELVRYERLGALVILASTGGRSDFRGYSDAGEAPTFVPTPGDVAQHADAMRPIVLARLGIG